MCSDNYESEVARPSIWLVSGYQHISTAFAYGLGYKFRMAIWRKLFSHDVCNRLDGIHVIHFFIVVTPSVLSYLWRVN